MSANARKLTLEAGKTLYEVKQNTRSWPKVVGYYVPKSIMPTLCEIEELSKGRREKAAARRQPPPAEINEQPEALQETVADESESSEEHDYSRDEEEE